MAIEEGNNLHPIHGINEFHEHTSSRLHTRHVEEQDVHYHLRKQLMDANDDYTRLQVEQANTMTLAIVASILGIASAPFGKDSSWGNFFTGISGGVNTIGQFWGQLKKAETAQIEGARNILQIEMKRQTANKEHILQLIRSVDQAVEESKRYMRKADGAFFS